MEGPGSSDRDLNQNVSTHVPCILFTHTGSAASYVRVAPRCSESSESFMIQKQIRVKLEYPSQQTVNQQLCHLYFLSQTCLLDKNREDVEGGENKRGRQRRVRIVFVLGAESVLCLRERGGMSGLKLQC